MDVIGFLREIDYGVTEGSQFCWTCYGPDAWYLDAGSVSAVIDRKTGFVYEISVHDQSQDVNHRWIHPEYLEGYVDEANSRGCDPWQAYDDVQYIRVDGEDHIMELVRTRAT